MIHRLVAALSLASAASAAVFNVTVGQGGLVFNPPSTNAQVGDTINFIYPGGMHSVTQTNFTNPCVPLPGGFDSGLVPGDSTKPPVYTLTIKSTAPLWFYCKQPGGGSPHCLAGMVGAINPPTSGNTLDVFTSNAKSLSALPPQGSANPTGGVGATGGGPPSANGASSGSATGTSSGAAATSTSPGGSSTASSGASPTNSNAALRSTVSSTGLWTLLAGFLGIVMG